MYLPPVDSGAGTPTATPSWSPENDQKVNNYIDEAMREAHGNVAQAFAYLRDKRDQPANYYDTNLAYAADYLRARWDTERHGPQAETEAISHIWRSSGRDLPHRRDPDRFRLIPTKS